MKNKNKNKRLPFQHVILQLNIVDFLEVYDDGHYLQITKYNIINLTVICTLTSK